MHIKSIHLDGFKSYQKHTDITGFSPQFNAITGYNGSGKSNVLDSICFILGINKLDNIRAKSMSELISHGGTKATVQIRFDNRDKTTSPYGMEQLDEITVQRTITAQATGKGCATSYILNGHAATNTRIQDFFRGIGLNVNNPHFLIMQGRITTVLNMKPEEILGMVEEAAGTKMYDQKKKEAEKTMYLKQSKLDEIDRIFDASIGPRMDKFREDRKNMIEATRLGKVKDNAARKLEAYQFYQASEATQRDIESMEVVKNEIEELNVKLEKVSAELRAKEIEKAALENMRDNPADEQNLSEAQRRKQAQALNLETEKNKIVDAISKLKKEAERTEKSIAKERKALDLKHKELEDTKAANNNDIQSHKNNEQAVETLRNELESLTRGTVANDKGEHVSVETMIQDTRSKAASLEAAIKTAGNRRDRAKNRLVQLEKELSDENSKSRTVLDNVKKHENDIAKLKSQMEGLGFDHEQHSKMHERHEYLKNRNIEIEEINTRILQETCYGRFSMVFTSPPIPGFDAKRDVIGLLIHCVTIKPGYEEYGAAIDVAAGGMYNNVVVRTQEIARILIDGKAFNGRRTMIPVDENDRNNGRFSVLSDSAFEMARQIAARRNERVVRLLDLIMYPPEINNTFLGAFGHVLVVDSIECAGEIAYNPAIKVRCLSVRGDDVKPNGVMAGGYMENGKTSILMSLQPWHKNNEEARAADVEIADLAQRLASNGRKSEQYKAMRLSLDKLEHSLIMINNNISNSKLGMIQKDVEEQKAIIESATKEIEESSVELGTVQAKVKELESKRSNDKGSKERMKKELSAKLLEAEKRAASHKDKAEKARRAVLQLQASVDELAQNIANDEAELEKKKKECEELEEKLPAAEEACAKAQEEEKGAQDELSRLRQDQRSLATRFSKSSKECDLLRKDENKTKHRIEDREKELLRLESSKKENQKIVHAMLKKSEWLEEEQAHFNKKGGLYDFEGYSFKKGTDEVKNISDDIEKLERSLCMKNISNLDTCEARVLDIKNKRARLQEDFNMLKKTIGVLDNKKVEELNRAHKSVNKDFGTIFNCLLPDATAQLIPPEGKQVTDGLEVKVAFNGVVKDSLHELSGGQRSLVALSLILAMLKFKPAPLYILDEVDAALDLSHTANIGMMIKTHFSENQFIIVSLKQGMFSNADSLFQTSFADGHSSCRMLTGAALLKAKNDTKLAQQAQEMAESEQSAAKKAKKPASKKLARPVEDEDA